MEAIELLKTIKNTLDNNPEVELTSPIMYDPVKMGYKVSFSVMEKGEMVNEALKIEQATYNSLMVTVEDIKIKS